MRRFDAILFDAGGVLVLPDPTVLGPLLVPLGGDPDVEVHRRAHYGAMARKSRAEAAETDWVHYNRTYVALVGVAHEHADFAADLLDVTRTPLLWRWPIPETIAALRALADAGMPMGVVSNATGHIEAELRRTEICQAGDGPGVPVRVVVDSHVVGVAKPDPAIFDHALAHFAEFDRSRIAYVGDSVVMDVAGARAAGLHPLLVDPYGDHDGAEYERIHSVAQLLTWL